MKKIKFVLILILFANVVIAQKNAVNQYNAIDKKALAIPDSLTKNTTDIANYISTNFYSKSDKTRAIFIWIASNISYDLENIFTIDFNETIEEKISKPLITRKGICGNYAALFTDICVKVGIESYVVSGYTKQNGYVSNLSHAWNAAYIDSTWFLFDPTWGAGYVSNEKFYGKIDDSWYKVKPNQFIKDHIPFDYLWQFLYYPINNQEFYKKNSNENKKKQFFNFTDSIAAYQKLDSNSKMIETVRRIEKNSVRNSLIVERVIDLKYNIENNRIKTLNNQRKLTNELYNSAVKNQNIAIKKFNIYIDLRNKFFMPQIPDSLIKNLLDSVDIFFNKAKGQLEQVKFDDKDNQDDKENLEKSMSSFFIDYKKQRDWLNKYFTKSKFSRKFMFYE
jgi:hypothetical protein